MDERLATGASQPAPRIFPRVNCPLLCCLVCFKGEQLPLLGQPSRPVVTLEPPAHRPLDARSRPVATSLARRAGLSARLGRAWGFGESERRIGVHPLTSFYFQVTD